MERTAQGPASHDEIVAQLTKAIEALRRVLFADTPEPSLVSESLQKRSTAEKVKISELNAAFAEIARMGKLLGNSEHCIEMADAVAEYKSLLRQFKTNLPRIHGRLLAERERLAMRSSHSKAVENWLRASRQTRW